MRIKSCGTCRTHSACRTLHNNNNNVQLFLVLSRRASVTSNLYVSVFTSTAQLPVHLQHASSTSLNANNMTEIIQNFYDCANACFQRLFIAVVVALALKMLVIFLSRRTLILVNCISTLLGLLVWLEISLLTSM